ncbi:MAG TPA: UDP-N-acetylmuramate--L-alanine ligase [Spirochaetota bacterium]|nr:UDP-N-acetylmuramate--L-alanine ligase [Spirochaetota bacterium]
MIFRNKNKMHFIGIGGVGMSGIAEILINLGYTVTGSDLRESEITAHLKKAGAEVFVGHYASNVTDQNVVITSTAIDPLNPEIIEARKRSIPIIHRSEMLAELVRLKHGIGVAGTHGKTTTSSMLSSVLWSCGVNPTSIIGGKVLNFGSNARKGEGDYIVFEADESDGSFLKLLPTIGVVTNIDADHLDYYKYFEGLKDAFLQYINHVPFYGYAVVCIDDPAVVSILPKIERPYFTYGISEDADFRASDIRFEDGMTRYNCFFRDEYLGEVALKLLGRHNVVNSLAVVTVARELEIQFDCIQNGLAEFEGVGRRLEILGEAAGVTVIDDYGHHPTEISATLSAVKSLGRRVVTIFQPHRYSRTQLLWDEFGKSFTDTDILFLADIYPASETPIEGVTSALIADSYMKHHGKEAQIIESFEKISGIITDTVREGDIVLTLGAGDIYRCGAEILKLLEQR